MMTPAAVLLEAVSAQDFFVARTRTNPETETGKLFEFHGKFKLILVVWIFARFLMRRTTNSRSRSTKKIVKLLSIRLLFQELYL